MAERRAKATSRAPLDCERIVAAAVELADEAGVDSLTMRELARRLDYEVMSLYNHVANKNELLRLMVDAVAGEITLPSDDPDGGGDALSAVRSLAVAMRGALVRHPWAPPLWLQHLPGPARTDVMEALLRHLADSALSAELAHHGFHAVSNHVLGYTLQEQGMAVEMKGAGGMDLARDFVSGLSPEHHPLMVAHVHQHLDGDTASSFELVLDLILDGLVHLDRGR